MLAFGFFLRDLFSSLFLSLADLVRSGIKNFGVGGLTHAYSVPLLFLPLSCISPHAAMTEMFQKYILSSGCCRKHEHKALGNHLPNDEKETPLITREISKRSIIGNWVYNTED